MGDTGKNVMVEPLAYASPWAEIGSPAAIISIELFEWSTILTLRQVLV